MKTISVIMPIYNTDEFLEQSIQSVLNQSHKNLELILINDNSSDNSQQIIEKFANQDKRIRVYQFEGQQGVGKARNFGIDMAVGTYIYFLDSDDYLAKNTLELLIENVEDYKVISGRHKRAHVSEITDNNDNYLVRSNIKKHRESKYSLIKNNSVLNHLFLTKYIKENEFRFSENVERYSDLAFIIPVFLKTEEVPFISNCLYYKRRRNDPITNPALMQTNVGDSINNFTLLYRNLKDKYPDENLQSFLDQQFINLYQKRIIHYFRMNKNVDNVFYNLVAAAERINPKALKNRPFMVKKEIKTFKKNNIQLFKKINLRHHRLRKIKEAFRGRTRFYIQIYRTIFLKMPIKEDTIVFESFLGKSYSDSPKYIYEYMISNQMPYKYIWIFNERKNPPGNAIQVKRFSLRYFYYLARAKYWVSNSRLPRTLNKRENNIYLQTWHGTPLKTLVFDMKDVYSADPAYKSTFYRQSRRWDYLSSPNNYSSEIFRRAFKFEKELLEFGYPRNDILYQKNNKIDILDLKKKMKLPTDKKVILYAPTWRDDEFYARGKYKFTLQLELNQLQKHLGDEYIVILRMHYFIASKLDISEYEGFVYDYSRYDDIAELYLISDILITDYSSVFFDYANLKRPILFYTYDLEKYRDKLRGFYIDIESEVPGPILMTTKQVIDSIKKIDEVQQKYQLIYDEFYDRFCYWDNGNASKKTVETVFLDK